LTLEEGGTHYLPFHVIGAFQGRFSHASNYGGDDIRSFSVRRICVGSPPLGDERRSSRSNDRNGESGPRSSGNFNEGRRAARRLYPHGVTAAGEIVFPIQCRELIERQRGKAVEQKPAAVEEKPVAVEEKPAAKQSGDVAPRTANRQLSRLKQFHFQSALSTSRPSVP
jgi:hypothetical protein